jgi:transcriptional regulator with XRE-family HTH domain
MADEFSPEAVGRRLFAIRKALGIDTQTKLAEMIGANQSQYQNWENGTANMPVPFAIKLHIKTGFNLDYLFRGDESGLPLRLVTLLDESQSRLGQRR